MPLMQRIMKFVASSGILPDASLLELYPPFMPMRIKVLEISRPLAHGADIAAAQCAVAQSGWRDVWRLSGRARGSHRRAGVRAGVSRAIRCGRGP